MTELGLTPAQLVDALRRWHEESGLELADLAARTGLPPSSLLRYVDGSRNTVRSAAAARLARAIPMRHQLAVKATVKPQSDDTGMTRVFVSSTYLDNAVRRQQVLDVIARAGMQAIAMERFAASDRTARIASLEAVGTADAFIGILAWRYGWIPDGEERSITELEYQAAVDAGLPRLMFVIDEQKCTPNLTRDFDQGPDRMLLQHRLDQFKHRVSSEQMTAPFTDENLGVQVFHALQEWSKRSGRAADQGQEPQPRPIQEHKLADYLAAIQAEHGTVHLVGFEKRLHVPLSLEELFVPLDLMRGEDSLGPPKPEHEDPFSRLDREPTLSLADALARIEGVGTGDLVWKNRRGLVILGHPGSGKTTQLRRVALSLATGSHAALGVGSSLVPVFLPLRNLSESDASLSHFYRRALHELGISDPEFADWLWDETPLLLLFDGMDEVPSGRKEEVRRWIEGSVRGASRRRALVTSRFAGYEGKVRLNTRFVELRLRPLSNDQVASFVRRWYHVVETSWTSEESRTRTELRRAEEHARSRAEKLIDRLSTGAFRDPRVYELTHNPLLLTAICLVDRSSKLRPRRRELYHDCISVLLDLWRDVEKELPVSFQPEAARRVLQRIALDLHQVEGRTRAPAGELLPILTAALREQDAGTRDPEVFLRAVRDESGLFTGWGNDAYGFLHLGFQEYLAARELADRAFAEAGNAEAFQAEVQALAALFGKPWWREVLCLVVGDERKGLFGPFFRSVLQMPVLSEHQELIEECLTESLHFDPLPFAELIRAPVDRGLWRNRALAAEVLRSRRYSGLERQDIASAVELLKSPSIHEQIDDLACALTLLFKVDPGEALLQARRLRVHPRASVRTLAGSFLSAHEPATQGAHVALGESPDHTPERLHEERSGCELVLVPGGRFLMGSPEGEEGRFGDEGPQHEVVLAPFYLAVHPVTNEQYARFLKANPSIKEPAYWGDRNYNQPRQPVVGVSWEEAKAFCDWAGLVLPTEAQWERACRAGTTTRYWSGDGEQDLAGVGWYGNNSGSRLHPVGEKAANPYGLLDMHGNVWEWCADGFGPYGLPVRDGDGLRSVEGAGYRVSRGGSFRSPARRARSAFRNDWRPGDRDGDLGFRPAQGITPV